MMVSLVRTMRFSGFVAVAATLLCAGQTACSKQPKQIDGYGAAAEWNGFSETERATYVEGYMGGYGLGTLAACENADRLFEAKPPPVDGDGIPNTPSHQCIKALDDYTRMGNRGKRRPDYTMYTNVITELYAKYPKYDNVPFSWLMTLLSDKQYTSADQVFQKLEKHDMQWTY